jgi:hypothetical protein
MKIRTCAVLILSGFSWGAQAADRPPTSASAGAKLTVPVVSAQDIEKLNAQNRDNAKKAGKRAVVAQNSLIDPDCTAITDYADPQNSGKPDRQTFCALRTNRGTTKTIPESVIIKYCSDKSGCEVRIGMHNWDDTGRVASRTLWFYYNKNTRVWRSGDGDTSGTNNNNVTEHVNQSWSCYFTDGKYSNWADQGDVDADFGLLSWNQYNADCIITFIN